MQSSAYLCGAMFERMEGMERNRASTGSPLSERVIERALLTVRSKREDDQHRLVLEGELDMANSGALDEELRRVEKGDAGQIVIDLRGLSFIDSSGLHILLQTLERSAAEGKRLLLIRGREEVQRLFEITGLDKRLPFIS